MDPNGGNNPPMPKVKGENSTGVVFSSTDNNNLRLPSIAGPHAPTIEGVRHANVDSGEIMSYLKKQNRALTRFTWSSSQLPGTILFSTPVTPLRGNENVAYLAKMFNLWVGGMDYETKVAGTGFHAGAIGMVRIPPNIDPYTLKTVQQFTAFEYSLIDPKNLEAVTNCVSDQRTTMYHYMSEDFSEPNNIGGYFVIFVFLQLNTSSTGTNQIDVQVFNKLAPDFRFIQVVPPNLSIIAPTDDEKWTNLFNSPDNHLSPVVVAPINTINFQPNTFSTAAKIGLVNLAGNYVGNPSYIISQTLNGLNYLGYLFYANTTTNLIPVQDSSASYNRSLTYTGATVHNFVPVSGPTSSLVASTSTTVNLHTNSNPVSSVVVGVYYYLTPSFSSAAGVVGYPSVTALSPQPGESLVTFSTEWQQSSALYTLTTTYFENIFKTGNYRIQSNEAVLLKLSSKSTGADIGYLKLYYGGYFTTNSRTTILNMDMADIMCTFVQFMQAATPIPGLSQQMINMQQQFRLQALLARADRLHIHD